MANSPRSQGLRLTSGLEESYLYEACSHIADKIVNSGLLYIYYTLEQREYYIQLSVLCFIKRRNWNRREIASTVKNHTEGGDLRMCGKRPSPCIYVNKHGRGSIELSNRTGI